jgi:hypothetical protein
MCMMEPMLLEAIAGEVERKVVAGEMFTALDVSRALRVRGYWARHGHIKRAVHDLFACGYMGPEYRRTLCDVGGYGGPAWVYHAAKHDPVYYLAGLTVDRMLRATG